MKKTLQLCLLLFAGYSIQTSAQSFVVNNISLSKELIALDSLHQSSLTAAIDLGNSATISKVHCRIKGVTSDTAYADTDFIVPSTEGTYINGIMKDKQMLFVNLGTFPLREPIVLETELIDENNNRSNTYQTNE